MKLGRITTFTSLVMALAFVCAPVEARVVDGIAYQTGDVVFQQIGGELGRLVQGITRSPFDHCGIVIVNDDGTIDVLEAITRVQLTSLAKWKGRGLGERIHVMRPLEAHQKSIRQFIEAAEKFTGLPYDRGFRMDDDSPYCSELIYKAFLTATGVPLAPFQSLAELHFLRHLPEILILGRGEFPWDRALITPVALTRSSELRVVHSEFEPST